MFTIVLLHRTNPRFVRWNVFFSRFVNFNKFAFAKITNNNNRRMPPKIKGECICEQCGNIFSSRRSLREHIRRTHKNQPSTKRSLLIICPICDEKFHFRQELFSHLSLVHEIKIQFERKEFCNMNAFMEWKEKMEKQSRTQYVLKRGVRTLKDHSKKLYYHCSRSGDYEQDKLAKSVYKSQGDGSEKKARCPRRQGSRKIGKLCPAALEVTYNSDHATALFWSTHIGHTNDLRHCTISKLERNAIAAKLSEGETVDHILNDIKGSAPASSEQLSRLHLITRKDVTNIQNLSAANNAKRLLIYVESESQLQDEMRKKIEQIRRLCDDTVHEEAMCRGVIEHLDSAMKILEAGQKCSLIRTITQMPDDEENTGKQREIFSVRRKKAIKREEILKNKEELVKEELSIVVQVKEDGTIDTHIENDHCYA